MPFRCKLAVYTRGRRPVFDFLQVFFELLRSSGVSSALSLPPALLPLLIRLHIAVDWRVLKGDFARNSARPRA